MIEPGHPREADLERDRDVTLGLLSAPAGRLREHLDERRARVRVRLDVKLPVRGQSEHDQQRGACKHEQGHAQGCNDDPLNHFNR